MSSTKIDKLSETGEFLNAEWATWIGGAASEEGLSITADANGNMYVIGYYSSNPSTIYNSDGSTFGALANDGSNGAFLVKYNSSGMTQWVTRVDGTGNDVGYSVSLDTVGNVYVTGSYSSNPVTIYNADGTSFGTLANDGNSSTFIVKYNSSGIGQWSARIDGTGNESGQGLSTDSTGNVYVTGSHTSNPVTIYNADGTSFGTLGNAGGFGGFIVKYNSSGVAQWSARIDGTGNEFAFDVATDTDGNVLVTGSHTSNPVTVYNADGTSFGTLEGDGSFNSFIVKYNPSGVGQWISRVVNAGLYSVTVDSGGNIYMVGNGSDSSVVYNSDTSSFGNLTGGFGGFLVKYNSSGMAQWVSRIIGGGFDSQTKPLVQINGNIFITGYYNANPVTILNADGSVFGTLENDGSYAVFIIKFNSLGVGQVSTRIDGTGYEQGNSITADGGENIYVTGYYESDPLTIYNSDSSTFGTLEVEGSASTFIVKYNTNGGGTPEEPSGTNLWWVFLIVAILFALMIFIIYTRNRK